jgi:hypothetical protein
MTARGRASLSRTKALKFGSSAGILLRSSIGDHPPLGVLVVLVGHWSVESASKLLNRGEERFDGIRMANVMGCLYRRAWRTRMASKWHLVTEK